MDDFRVVIFTILALLIVGVPIGFMLRRYLAFRKVANRVVSLSVFMILFLLGAGLGSNNDLMTQLTEMSYAAIIISFGAFVGSVLAMIFVYQFFFVRSAGTAHKFGGES